MRALLNMLAVWQEIPCNNCLLSLLRCIKYIHLLDVHSHTCAAFQPRQQQDKMCFFTSFCNAAHLTLLYQQLRGVCVCVCVCEVAKYFNCNSINVAQPIPFALVAVAKPFLSGTARVRVRLDELH
jgi:hypothetical protein